MLTDQDADDRNDNAAGHYIQLVVSQKLDGNYLRREPFEVRKQTLASLLRSSLPGVQFNAHLTHPGDLVFENACNMPLEGIVSKRLGSTYRSGRSPDLP